MERQVLADRSIREYLSGFSEHKWPTVLQLTIRHGIHQLRTRFDLSSLSEDDLRELVRLEDLQQLDSFVRREHPRACRDPQQQSTSGSVVGASVEGGEEVETKGRGGVAVDKRWTQSLPVREQRERGGKTGVLCEDGQDPYGVYPSWWWHPVQGGGERRDEGPTRHGDATRPAGLSSAEMDARPRRYPPPVAMCVSPPHPPARSGKRQQQASQVMPQGERKCYAHDSRTLMGEAPERGTESPLKRAENLGARPVDEEDDVEQGQERAPQQEQPEIVDDDLFANVTWQSASQGEQRRQDPAPPQSQSQSQAEAEAMRRSGILFPRLSTSGASKASQRPASAAAAAAPAMPNRAPVSWGTAPSVAAATIQQVHHHTHIHCRECPSCSSNHAAPAPPEELVGSPRRHEEEEDEPPMPEVSPVPHGRPSSSAQQDAPEDDDLERLGEGLRGGLDQLRQGTLDVLRRLKQAESDRARLQGVLLSMT